MKSAKSRVESVSTLGSRAVSPLLLLALMLREEGLLTERRIPFGFSCSAVTVVVAVDVVVVAVALLPARPSDLVGVTFVSLSTCRN